MSYVTAPSSNASLVPVASGLAYRVESPPGNALVTRELADELRRVLEIFAREAGFDEKRPVGVFFKPGVVGHHQVGRAADIYEVERKGLDRWRRRWEEAMRRGKVSSGERRMNLGWRLYKTLQIHGRWSQPYGYPIQLFGPWTRSEGPWTFISDRLLNAHRDHIHIAK
jgi:hypothetical protein